MGVAHIARSGLRKPPAIATFFICVLLYILYRNSLGGTLSGFTIRQQGRRHRDHPSPEGKCIPELGNLYLKDKVFLSRRCVTPIFSNNVNRGKIVQLPDDPLIKTNTFVDMKKCDPQVLDSIPCEPLELEVSYPFPEVEYPEFLFGVTTSYGRLVESMGPWIHWLSHSKAKIIAVVTDRVFSENDPDRTSLEQLMAKNGIDIKLVNGRGGGLDRAREHFLMMSHLADNLQPYHKWIGILDDDTFFPSMHPIRENLSKYDPNKRYYIGALSENFGAVVQWGFQAFGGAGVFLSVRLLHDLTPWLETCAQTSNTNQGDVLLRQCVDWYARTHLTLMPGLYQVDLMHDINGFYEGGINPLSLHHWKSWHHAPVADMARVGHLCSDCFLQRWMFGKNIILANGFSINVYGDGILDSVNLERVEGTWHGANDPRGQWDFSMGPLRQKIDKVYRKRFLLVETEWLDEHTLRQVYVWNGTRPDDERNPQKRSVDLSEEFQSDALEYGPYQPQKAKNVDDLTQASSGFASRRNQKRDGGYEGDRNFDEVFELFWKM